MDYSHSQKNFKQAQEVIPGGVNSPVRAFGLVGGDPVFISRASGAHVWDVDDQKYIDYVGSWGVAVLGHAHPEVINAIHESAKNGLSFGAPTHQETLLVRKIQSAFPSMEKIRLVSSGTEACMTAIRLARGFTGRKKIIKFSGHYHGHADVLLAKAGSGMATLSIPQCAGVPEDIIKDTLIAPFNNLNAIKTLFSQYKNEIAAIILEPVVGNAGFIRPQLGFLEALRELTQADGSLLIFDEVITGFRLCWGGVQTLHHIVPDITTLGKIIGGGLPLAAFGGRKEIMDCLAPLGPVYQAGTLSGNPVAVASGLKTLELLETDHQKHYASLSVLTQKLAHGLKMLADEYNIPFSVDCEGGMFGFFFNGKPVTSFEDAQTSDVQMFKSFFRMMLDRGVYLAPSPYEAGFVSMAHKDVDIDATLQISAQVFSELADSLRREA